MITDAVLAYLHFVALFGLAWAIAQEWLLLRAPASALDVERLARTDAMFGLFAGLVLVSGAARAIWGLKGWAFYAGNPVFHAKITLFVLVGLMSIVPTLAILRWRRARRADPGASVAEREWRRVRSYVLVELHLLALIPLAAVIMARGLR